MYTQHPILTEKQNCLHFCRFIKKEKLKYHMVLSIKYIVLNQKGASTKYWAKGLNT